MIIINCTVDPTDLTLEILSDRFNQIESTYYAEGAPFPPVSIKCFPDEIWITQWQQDNIFSSAEGPHKTFRDVPLKVKFKE